MLVSKAGNEYCGRKCWIKDKMTTKEHNEECEKVFKAFKEKCKEKGFDYKDDLPFVLFLGASLFF